MVHNWSISPRSTRHRQLLYCKPTSPPDDCSKFCFNSDSCRRCLAAGDVVAGARGAPVRGEGQGAEPQAVEPEAARMLAPGVGAALQLLQSVSKVLWHFTAG